jgi:phage terminase small subunit
MTRQQPAGIGTAPAHLDDAVRVVWTELAGQLAPGVASAADAAAFEALARLVVDMRRNPLTPAAAAQLLRFFREFGLTPEARRRLTFSPFLSRDDA